MFNFFWSKKKHGRPIDKPQNDYDAIFQIIMHQVNTATGEGRAVMVAKLADYLSKNLAAVPDKLLKDIKRTLQRYDARKSEWKPQGCDGGAA